MIDSNTNQIWLLIHEFRHRRSSLISGRVSISNHLSQSMNADIWTVKWIYYKLICSSYWVVHPYWIRLLRGKDTGDVASYKINSFKTFHSYSLSASKLSSDRASLMFTFKHSNMKLNGNVNLFMRVEMMMHSICLKGFDSSLVMRYQCTFKLAGVHRHRNIFEKGSVTKIGQRQSEPPPPN